MVSDAVRQLIRQRIQDGRLPREGSIAWWHGAGFGRPCDGCGMPIVTGNMMGLMRADDWRSIRFHEDCFRVWDTEVASKLDQK